jgi:hypothetical protein
MLRRIPPKNMEVPRALPVGLHGGFNVKKIKTDQSELEWQSTKRDRDPLSEIVWDLFMGLIHFTVRQSLGSQ